MRKIEEIIQRIIKEYEQLYINKLENQKKWTILRSVSSPKNEPERNGKYEQTSYGLEIESIT